MSVKFCGQCGNTLEEGATFCTNCGWKVVSPNGVPSGVEPQHHQAPQQVQQPQYQQQYQQPQFQQPPYMPPTPVKKKSGCGGCLIAIIIVALLAAAMFFFGGKLIAPVLEKMGIDTSEMELPKVDFPIDLPNIVGGDSDKLAGPYQNEFKTLSVLVNGQYDPNYVTMIGQTQTINSTITMTDGKSGSMMFSGSSYGFEYEQALPVTLEGDKVSVLYEDPNSGMKTVYNGSLIDEDGKVRIEGTYETSYKDEYSGMVLTMSGEWKAFSSKGKVDKDLEVSKAKKDVVLEDLQGTWSGTFIYTRIDNLDEMPDVTEEDKEMARSMIGQQLNARYLFEGDNLMITIEDPTGGESDLEDMPPIFLEDGVFTSAMTMEESEGVGNMNLSGVVYEEDGQLKIRSILSMEMAFVKGTTIVMVIEMDVVKDPQ